MSKKQAVNPYLPSYEYVPDGEPRVFGNRLYVYGSHDRFNGNDFCLNDYVCWSAPTDDLGNWKYEGIIYRADQDPKNGKNKMHMNAPDVVQGVDGRYYLYYQLHEVTGTAVAVCDTPAGKYEFYGYVNKDGRNYGEKKGDPFGFDPGVLVEDGHVFLYVGFAPGSTFLKKMMELRGNVMEGGYCIELEPDMITVKKEAVLVIPGITREKNTSFSGHSFFEASSPRKIGGKYYLVYSSILSHELCYAVSEYPDRNFSYGGTIISNGDIGYKGKKEALNYTGNTHGGMVEVNGQWYIFYHRQTNKQKCARQGCAEKIYFLEDGSIPQAEMTSCGLNDGPLSGSGTYEARIACNLQSAQGTFPYLKVHEKDRKKVHPYFTQSGGDREENGDQYIANMRDGATAGYKYFDLRQPEKISVCVRSTTKGCMEVRTQKEAECIAVINVGNSTDWEEFTADMKPVSGILPLYFTWRGEGSCDFQKFILH